MHIDVTPLLKRLVLAGLPLAGLPLVQACYCGEFQPNHIFDATLAIHETEFEFLRRGHPRLDAGEPLPDGGEGLRQPLSAEEQTQYDGCLTDPQQCRALCQSIARRWYSTAVAVQACHLEPNGTSRPDLYINGLGTSAVCGRRPHGLRRTRNATHRSSLGEYLAQAAYLEAASVTAFERLGAELDAHRAPIRLGVAARRAARDEARHARLMGRLARTAGGRPPALRVAPARPRSLAALASENAVEGCVRETFGALVAWWQAAAAADPAVKSAARSIAPDESRHANLAWQINAWARPRLNRRSLGRVQAARVQAVDRLAAEWGQSLPAEVRNPLGLPDGPTALSLLAALDQQLFAAQS